MGPQAEIRCGNCQNRSESGTLGKISIVKLRLVGEFLADAPIQSRFPRLVPHWRVQYLEECKTMYGGIANAAIAASVASFKRRNNEEIDSAKGQR